jgi:hypothetical protein
MTMSKRLPARYWQAIVWIAANDDNEWLDDEHGSPSVTLSLVTDVFNVPVEQATEHLRKALGLEAAFQAKRGE